MSPPRIAAALAVVLLGATSTRAVEVRQPETAPRYHADLMQAYAACVAPNEVAVGGTPACSPPVRSACPFTGGSVDIEGVVDAPPTMRAYVGGATRPAGCPDGPYDVAVTLRVSGTPRQPVDREAPPVPSCSTGECTYPDVVVHVPVNVSTQQLNPTPLPVPNDDLIDANYEILDVTVFGTDGVPVAGPGPSGFDTVTGTNLTAPYEPCTTPDPDGSGIPCNRKPWTSACDFDVGSVDWIQLNHFNPPKGHVALAGVTGRSPLCTDGTYAVQATLRGTLDSCGADFDYHLCTLVDRTVTIPLAMSGGALDASGAIDLGAFVSQYRYTQISSVRLLDPTGAPVAATGVSAVRNLGKPQVTIKNGQIRVHAVIPLVPAEPFGVVLDPVLPYGMTLAVSDRDGVVYGATIPGTRWQLQPPIGSRWTYVDKGGVIAGVRTARIKRIGKAGVATGYQVDLLAKGVDLSAADFPGVEVRITIAQQDAAEPYRAQRNRTCRVKGTTLTCR